MCNEDVLAISPLPKNDANMEELLAKYSVVQYDLPVSIIKRPSDIFLKNGEQLEADFPLLTTGKSSLDIDQSNTLIGDSILLKKVLGFQLALSMLKMAQFISVKMHKLWRVL